jgi:hypothetical protein
MRCILTANFEHKPKVMKCTNQIHIWQQVINITIETQLKHIVQVLQHCCAVKNQMFNSSKQSIHYNLEHKQTLHHMPLQ